MAFAGSTKILKTTPHLCSRFLRVTFGCHGYGVQTLLGTLYFLENQKNVALINPFSYPFCCGQAHFRILRLAPPAQRSKFLYGQNSFALILGIPKSWWNLQHPHPNLPFGGAN